MPELTSIQDDVPQMNPAKWDSSRHLGIFSLMVMIAGWSVGILFAIGMSFDFMWRVGEVGTPPIRWPEEISSVHIAGKPLVLVFLHPQCPCSRATLDELSLAMSHTSDRLQYVAVFEHLPGRDDSWTEGDLWKQAEKIAGLKLVHDRDGSLVDAFHAKTSGDTVVYSADGDLLFHGGLTPGRDHRGSNAGRHFLETWTCEMPAKLVTSPVFGCPLCAAPSSVTSSPRQENIRDAP